MTHAYDKKYLDDAMRNLGEAMDFAGNVRNLDLDEFLGMFIASGIAGQFGKGVPKYVSGMSGTELVLEVLQKSGISANGVNPQTEYACSPEYWCGWVLAYFQWYSGRPFRNIRDCVSMHDIEQLYPALHEASEDKFVDTVNGIIRKKHLPTRLQTQRKNCGLTQKDLSEKSGVNLRTLQQYELRSKNINKAAAETLRSLAQVLSCEIEDLLEYDCSEVETQED